MTDTALIIEGVVAQVWRAAPAADLPAPDNGQLVEFPSGEAVCGLLWDGAALVEPAPTPVRRLIPKSTVTARLRGIGKFTDAWNALRADGDLFDKWFTPDWPNVYADDDGLLAFLGALGLTEEQITDVTAP